MAHPRSGASAFGWRPAWQHYDDDELHNVEYYDLPTDEIDDGEYLPNRRLHNGDRFFDTEERYQITIVDVRTKVYRGVVGPQGKEGNDAVFYETDWNPPRSGGMFSKPHHPHRDDEPFVESVDDFVYRLQYDTLIPHRGNGITAPP